MDRHEEHQLLLKIARMYYEQDLTQAQIAKALGIYRTTISRMLKRIRQQGIVTISINPDAGETLMLEQQLKALLGLKEIRVVADTALEPLEAMGQAGARLLGELVRQKDVIGFSWGSAVAAVVGQLAPAAQPELSCIPLVGGPAGKLESRYHVNTLVYQAAQRLGASSLLIDYPTIFEQTAILQAISQTPHVREIAALWARTDVAW